MKYNSRFGVLECTLNWVGHCKDRCIEFGFNDKIVKI